MDSTRHPDRLRSPRLAALAGVVALALAGCATTEERSRTSLDAAVRCAAGEGVACRAGRVERYGLYDPWAAYSDPWYRERSYRERYHRDRYYRGREGYRDRWADPWGYGDPFWSGHRWGAPGYRHDPRLGDWRHRRAPDRAPDRAPGDVPTPPAPPPSPGADAGAPPDPPAISPWQGTMPTRPPRTQEP